LETPVWAWTDSAAAPARIETNGVITSPKGSMYWLRQVVSADRRE
jgi:hypothetical protein